MGVAAKAQTARREMSQLLAGAHAGEARLVERLHELVACESPSSDKAAVERALAMFGEWAAQAGGRLRWHRHRGHADSLEVRFGKARNGEKPVLLLGHLDTVWDHGTLARMPWTATSAKIAGPGVFDMKAGALMALAAIESLQATGIPHSPVVLLLHGDEEIGSPASRPLTEKIALGCRAVYVLEPAQGDRGAYKTARKAVGMYRLEVRGVASHSGVDFGSGHSAVLELAHQLETLASFTDSSKGITVNPGVIGGGTRSNVVAANAWAEIDVRVPRARDVAPLDRKIRRLKPRDRHCTLEVTGGINRPPMERTAGTAALFRRAQSLAAELGFALEEAATGGASDGNFTSALGVATLDGMGAVGAGAHALSEHLERAFLAPRTALLAGMLLD